MSGCDGVKETRSSDSLLSCCSEDSHREESRSEAGPYEITVQCV